MQGRCGKHVFEASDDICGKCGGEYCSECLVYSFGPKRPPFCIGCAIAAAGIRSSAAGSGLSRREMKRLRKEREVAQAAGEAARVAETTPSALPHFDPLAGLATSSPIISAEPAAPQPMFTPFQTSDHWQT
jgi:hypothetical protein